MSRLSFGVELEFNLASLIPGGKPIPTETRQVVFTTPPSEHFLHYQVTLKDKMVIDAVATFLNSKGFPVDLDAPDVKTMNTWQVALDGSLLSPEYGHPDYYRNYEYTHLEVKTPALEYNRKGLENVKQVCNLLKSTYVVSNNESSGLHVHIGRFSVPVPFHLNFLKKLVIFLYVFDPQIASIHAPDRVVENRILIGSIRDRCTATTEFQGAHGYRPLPAQLIDIFMSAPDIETLLTAAGEPERYSNYNFLALIPNKDEPRNAEGRGHTIEFRQHAGTLDGDEICMWIRVLAGIIRFVDDVTPESYLRLTGVMLKAETWEKEGDGKDEKREAKYGPIPADGAFTIVDLLQHIGLDEEAEYYSSRWRIHVREYERLTFFDDI